MPKDRPLEGLVEEENERARRRRDRLRTAAGAVAAAFSELPFVQKVVLFGSAARDPETTWRRYRGYGRVEVERECDDVDLAVWLTDLTDLAALQRARNKTAGRLDREFELGVANHQIEVFVMEPRTNRYLGRLCTTNACPRPGKEACWATGCGAPLHLKQIEGFAFQPEALSPDRSEVLFERGRAPEALEKRKPRKRLRPWEEPLQIRGLPWFGEFGGGYHRLPFRIESEIGRDLWWCARNTSGARIRFASNTSQLGIKADFTPYDGSARTNMSLSGVLGIDVYADGSYWKTIVRLEGGEFEEMFFREVARKRREFTVYLPLYHSIDVKRVLFDEDAEVLPPTPFAVEGPVVFYGTSITQGGCASRPGLSYQARLCRALNLDFVNLGFSGLGRGDLPVAQAMARLDASCYVLDYGQNNPTVEEMDRVYLPFLRTIREAKPDTPIVLTTPISYAAELWIPGFHEEREQRRDVVRRAYLTQREAGDQRIFMIEGKDLLSLEDGDGQVDGAHPNDLGFAKMAAAMQPLLREALGL